MSINLMTTAPAEPTYQPTPEELTLDTGDFDIFSSLDDLVVENVAPQENVQNEDAAMPAIDAAEEDTEFSEDFDFDAFDFDSLDDEQEEIEAETGEEVEDEIEDEVEEDEIEDEAEDVEYDEEDLEEEVEYESYEVTLPNGETVVLQDAIEGYRSAEALREEREAFESTKARFQEEAGNTYNFLKLAKLEADRVIEDYQDFNWAELAKENPQAYVENKEFLEKYMIRQKEIKNAMVEVEAKEAADKQAVFKEQARSCVTTLKAEVPGWNEAMYQDLMSYAIENGASENEITKCVDPSIFKMLHKARQFDKGREVAKAKVKKAVRSPKKVTRSASKSTKAPTSNKARIAKKMDLGFTSDSDVFAALED